MAADQGKGIIPPSSTPQCKSCGRYNAQGDGVKCPKSEVSRACYKTLGEGILG